MKKEKDIINQPDHYMAGGIEAVDVLRAKLTPEQLEGYYLGTQIIYLLRSNFKGEKKDDHKKAQVYAKWLAELPEVPKIELTPEVQKRLEKMADQMIKDNLGGDIKAFKEWRRKRKRSGR